MSTGGFWSAFVAFLLFAGTMGFLMVAVALLVGASQKALLNRLRASARRIQTVGSVMLVLVGAGLIYFTVDTNRFRELLFP